MAENTQVDLSSLFENALQFMAENRQAVNDLDDNGNHGDNMVENVQLIIDSLQSRKSKPPATALKHAGKVLKKKGRGGTSQYYARGLEQAAREVKGRKSLEQGDVMTIVQSLLGSIPTQGHPKKTTPEDSVLTQVLGLLGGQQAAQSAPEPESQPEKEGFDIGGLVSTLLPAGLAFLQAKQSGADNLSAAGQALMGAFASGQADPVQQASNSRTAAGGLIAQGLVQALLNQ